jgi:flavorubredoxin
MEPRKIRSGIYSVGAIDWSRRLFDSLIPLPDGTSYNSYLIQSSEKTALLDTVDPTMTDVLIDNLKQLGINKIDYIVTHHAEQDHSGSLPAVLAKYPGAKIVTSPRCKRMLVDLLQIAEDKFIEVQDGETLSLGNHTLKFIYTPWVHWPETMVTHLLEEKILFSCDFFGSHLATSELFVKDEGQMHESAKRYYAEIMMPFHSNIERNLEKLQGLSFDLIAPSHGPIHNNPEAIIKLYRSWVFDEPKNIAVVAYTSMHGSTQLMVNHLANSLAAKGVEVKLFDLSVTDLGKLAMSLVDAATIIIGTPTVLAGPHPNVVVAAFLANALRPKLKYATIIGSFLWGGKTVDVLKGLLPNLNVQLLEPVIVKGLPKQVDYSNLDKLADSIAEKHKDLQKPADFHLA